MNKERIRHEDFSLQPTEWLQNMYEKTYMDLEYYCYREDDNHTFRVQVLQDLRYELVSRCQEGFLEHYPLY